MDQDISILVVDDSPTQVALLQDALEDRGFLVETARNGVEAIAKVYQNPPGLVLSDIMMPELNGYHLCRLLKNDPATAPIPVILLTNLTEPHDRFWGKNAGADLYLEKNSETPSIAAAVENFINDYPVPRPKATAAPKGTLQKEDIQSRITSILDRLLYESTISNEILKLTSLTHDIEALAGNLLKFLGAICRHDAAGVVLRQGHSKYTLAFSINHPMPPDFIPLAQQTMMAQFDSAQDSQAKTHLLLFPQSPPVDAAGAPEFHVFHALPVTDGEEQLGLICLFNRSPRELTDGINHALDIVADRFLIVARYLNKLGEIDEVKADVISMLVHDLRSPLTSIRGFSEVLAQGMMGEVNRDQKTALENILRGSDRLLALIEDILHLSKLEAGKMVISPAPLHLAPLIHQTMQDLAALFLEKNLEVRIDVPEDLPALWADGQQLSRVLSNLLTNAAQFSPRNSPIRLVARRLPVSDEEPANLQIEVEDAGPGIPEEQQKTLFSRYQQVGGEVRRARKGTGLGLAICKEIVHLHHGRIWVECPAQDTLGTRFCFTIPLFSEG